MNKNIALAGVATFAVLGICFSAQAIKPTEAERDARRAEMAEMTPEERTAARGDRKAEAQDARGEKKDERIEKREEKMEKKCERAEKRIQTRTKRYENKQSQHRNIFGKMVTRTEALAVKLKAKNLDTTTLEAGIAELKLKTKALEEEHIKFIAELKGTETLACGESDGAFKNKLGEARKMSSEVKDQIVEIREHYQTVLRPEIISLREQLERDTQE